MITFVKSMYSVICLGLLAAQLTRGGRWRSAYKLMNGNKHAL